jgi:hypothetical protein
MGRHCLSGLAGKLCCSWASAMPNWTASSRPTLGKCSLPTSREAKSRNSKPSVITRSGMSWLSYYAYRYLLAPNFYVLGMDWGKPHSQIRLRAATGISILSTEQRTLKAYCTISEMLQPRNHAHYKAPRNLNHKPVLAFAIGSQLPNLRFLGNAAQGAATLENKKGDERSQGMKSCKARSRFYSSFRKMPGDHHAHTEQHHSEPHETFGTRKKTVASTEAMPQNTPRKKAKVWWGKS